MCNPEGRECIESIPAQEYNCHQLENPCTGLYADIQHMEANSTMTKDTEWSRLMFREYDDYKRAYQKDFEYNEFFKSRYSYIG